MMKQGLLAFDGQVMHANQGGLVLYYLGQQHCNVGDSLLQHTLGFAKLSPTALQSRKGTIMANHPSATARLTAVRSYLEDAFPGRVEAAKDNLFIISLDGIRHHDVLQPSFLRLCPDYTRALREAELTAIYENSGHKRDSFSSSG